LEQTVQLLTGATDKLNLLLTSNNVNRHLSQACLSKFMFPHTIKGELGVTFAQSC
jgi:hypothetical protein